VAQDLLVPYVSATTGVDAQSYRFGAGNPVRSIDQVAIPLGFVVPLGRRLSIDVAWTRVGLEDGTAPEIASLTDTQLRLAWLLGRDAAVLSLLVNLPTGAEQVTLGEFSAASAVATNFLPFPVHTYGTGAAVTAGAALAKPWGAWNVGLAGSLRLNGSYQPFANAPEEINYRQAIEGRVRVGVDRLVGSSRLSIGATVGTFGTDEFVNGSGTVVGEYRPGTRIMGEVSLASPLGSGAPSQGVAGAVPGAAAEVRAGVTRAERRVAIADRRLGRLPVPEGIVLVVAITTTFLNHCSTVRSPFAA
jgi:hypothetical protein